MSFHDQMIIAMNSLTAEEPRLTAPDFVVQIKPAVDIAGIPIRTYPFFGTGDLNARSIGRVHDQSDERPDIVLTDPLVSRGRHARVWLTDSGEFVVEDLDSAHGTLVIGQPRHLKNDKSVVADGAAIMIGSTILHLMTSRYDDGKTWGAYRAAARVEWNSALRTAVVDNTVDVGPIRSELYRKFLDILADAQPNFVASTEIQRQLDREADRLYMIVSGTRKWFVGAGFTVKEVKKLIISTAGGYRLA